MTIDPTLLTAVLSLAVALFAAIIGSRGKRAEIRSNDLNNMATRQEAEIARKDVEIVNLRRERDELERKYDDLQELMRGRLR